MTNWAARKAAQRAIKAVKCETCGATEHLQRHHPDINKPLEVQVLCQRCHTEIHLADGTWGQGERAKATCVICGKTFLPLDSHPHKTCSAACLSKLGRQNAMKRWGPGVVTGNETHPVLQQA